VNAGSVGRPKDGDWRACYVSLKIDGSGIRVEFVRVEYDIDEAARGIRESELPDEFADVLRSGGATAALTR
jgi:diadenosine tetraphosphatase ApaH/serine/threonine PP2A family protein phosphatase